MNVRHKKILISHHVRRRLQERRQDGVTEHDLYAACHKASEILTKGVPEGLKLRGFTSKEGVKFDIVVVDCEEGLKIVTVIGHKYARNRHDPIAPYRLHHLPYKKRVKVYRKIRKEERKWR